MSETCRSLVAMDPKTPKPPRPSDRLPRPSDGKSKSGKPAFFKDRRTHKIELRQKITKLKEKINELKNIETSDEAKQAEIQEAISELKIKLKHCDIEKEAIENFNHTQFLNNLEASDEGKDRYSDESTGNTRFFEHVQGTTASVSAEPEGEKAKPEPADPFLQSEQVDDTPPAEPEADPFKEPEASEDSEPNNPPPPIQLPPNTIV
ncbi:MAG: hypothetical protein VCA36_08570 [Opitutales bacterium]